MWLPWLWCDDGLGRCSRTWNPTTRGAATCACCGGRVSVEDACCDDHTHGVTFVPVANIIADVNSGVAVEISFCYSQRQLDANR